MDEREQRIIEGFHALYYGGLGAQAPIYTRTWWMGVPCLKCPLDLWVYQEILWEVKPDLIIETGTYAGGNALFLAHICDLIGQGEVITIDIREDPRPRHPRITYITGSSVAPETVEQVSARARGAKAVVVILDSDHSEAHVAKELALYAPLVTTGSYLIVEDTNINGHPVYPSFGAGPHEAVERFLTGNTDYTIDRAREKFLLTFNPGGFLRKR